MSLFWNLCFKTISCQLSCQLDLTNVCNLYSGPVYHLESNLSDLGHVLTCSDMSTCLVEYSDCYNVAEKPQMSFYLYSQAVLYLAVSPLLGGEDQAVSAMRKVILVPLFVSLANYAKSATNEPCCQTKTVKKAPDQSLDGVYTLKDDGAKRDPLCVDGCVYVRGGEDFCFITAPIAESADVQCKV